MGRFGRLLLVCVAIAAWPSCGVTQPGKFGITEGDKAIAALLPVAAFEAERGEAGDVATLLEPVMKDEVFSTLSPGRAYEVARLYGAAAHNLGDWDAAHNAMVRATAQPEATRDDWSARLESAILAADGPDSYIAFRHLVDARDEVLAPFSDRQLDRLDRQFGYLPNAREARLLLGHEMEREGWTPPFVFYDPSRVWLHYAMALMETQQPAKASAALARITDPTVIMAMQADRRFDGAIAANPSLQDADAAAQRYLAAARAYAQDNPRMISGRIAVSRALNILGRPAESLKLMQDTNLALSRGVRRQYPFDDMGEVGVAEYWRSADLISLGKIEEAVAARTAAACRCSPLDALQVARALLEAGRADEANQRLDGLGPDGLAPEDRMTLAKTRACAAVGDKNQQQKQLAFLAAHEQFDPEALDEALVCTGDLDRAAAVVTRQLSDPEMRLDALAALQAYADEPASKKHSAALRAGWAKLAAMPNVKAALDKVGRVKRFGLQRRDVLG